MDKKGSHWKDRLGIAASALCAVHCAATPVLLIFLPTLQFTEWMASPLFHQVAAIFCVSLVALSIVPAYRRHRDMRVLSFGGAGLGMILAAAFLLPDYCCGGAHHGHGEVGHGEVGHGEVTASSKQTILCNHPSCTHDHSVAATGTSSQDEGSGQENDSLVLAGISDSIWAWIQPWMTPIGGFFLIIAHVINMRQNWGSCSSHCGCNHRKEAPSEELAAQAA